MMLVWGKATTHNNATHYFFPFYDSPFSVVLFKTYYYFSIPFDIHS